MLDGMYVTKSISTGLYSNLDLWTANKLQLQLQLPFTVSISSTLKGGLHELLDLGNVIILTTCFCH